MDLKEFVTNLHINAKIVYYLVYLKFNNIDELRALDNFRPDLRYFRQHIDFDM